MTESRLTPEPRPERRAVPRHDIKLPATVSVEGKEAAADTCNMSSDGALLKLREGLAVETGQSIECRIPELTHQDALSLWASGQVVQVEGNAAAVRFEAGLFAAADDPQ